MTLALYGKTRRRQAGLLLGGIVAIVIAVSGGLLLREDNAKALDLSSAAGTWGAISVDNDSDCIVGVGTNEIRWGKAGDFDCGAVSDRSGYRWDGNSNVLGILPGTSFLLGKFTHFNRPIASGSSPSSVPLALPLSFANPAQLVNLNVTFAHDETPNGANPCAYPGADNSNGCADRVLLPNLGDQTFSVGGTTYILEFTGFIPLASGECPASPGVGEVDTFYTKEKAENLACVYGQLTVVRTIRVIKVADGSNAGGPFGGEITPGGPTAADKVFSLTLTGSGNSAADVNTATTAAQRVRESTLPGNWAPVGYYVHADTNGGYSCTGSETYTPDAEGAIVPEGEGNYTVCVKNSYTPPTHSIKVCKVVEQNNDGVDQGGNFHGWVLDKTAGKTTGWTLTGVKEGGDPVCTNVDTVPSDHTFNVTEFMPPDRPAGWVDDASGYPKYKDNQGNGSGDPTTVDYVPGEITGNVIVTFSNKSTPATRTIEVCKVVVDNGDGTTDGGRFAFAYDWKVTPGQLFIDATLAGPHAVEGGAPVCETFEAPSDKAVRIIEVNQRPGGSPQLPGSWNGDDPLYPQNSYDGLGTKDNQAELPVGVNSVTFYNKTLPRTKEVVVEKFYMNLGGYTPDADDRPTFTLSPDPFDGVGDYTVAADHCSMDATGTKWTCTVPASWSGTADEALPDGWRKVEGACEPTNNPVGAQHFAFCNEPYGTLRIEKVDGVNGATGPAWEFGVTGGAYTGANPTADQGAPFTAQVLLSATPINVTEVLARKQEQCATANTYYTIVTPPADTVLNTPDEIQTWTFQNVPCGVLGTGGVIIEKYLDINGDGDANDAGEGPYSGWTFTTTGGGIPAGNQVRQTAANGRILDYVSGFDAGTALSVTEAANTGWHITRVTLDNVNQGTNATNQVVVVGGQTRIIRYYNQPLGSITVHKTTWNVLNNIETQNFADDVNWKFTLTSAACGINLSGLTDASGNYTFAGLPLCTDYVITEDLAAKPIAAYNPVGSNVQSGLTPAIGGVTVNFVNETRGSTPPPVVIIETPVVPPPTATTAPPPPTPTEPKGAEPTPVSTVLGERTPGPAEPTPIPPSTGSGSAETGGPNVLVFVGALFAIGLGLATAATAGRRRS